jgi:hypothetical protein
MPTLKIKIKMAAALLLLAAVLAAPAYALADSCSNTTTNGKVNQTKVQNCVQSTPIWHDIQDIVNVLSAGVAVIVTGVIILGGVQYTIAGDNAQALQSARQRITNGLIALAAFLFIYAFLQWLIPGGIFQ